MMQFGIYNVGPWLHVATGAAVGYMFGSIPRLEKWVLKENERILGSMERRQKKQNAIYESTSLY